MKILQIHNFYQIPGGEDNVVRAEKELLESRGHTVTSYYRHNDEIKKYGFFKKIGFVKNVFYSMRTVKELAAIIDKDRPDITHVHNVFPLISPSAYYYLKSRGIPVTQTVHNYRFLCPNSLFYVNGAICEKCMNGNTLPCLFRTCYKGSVLLSGLYAALFWVCRRRGTFRRNIDLFIALNNFVKGKLVGAGFRADSIEVEGNFLNAGETNNLFAKDKYAVFIGRISAEKGLMTLLESCRVLKDLPLKIAGEGPLLGRVKDYVRFNRMSNVEVTGFVSGAEKNDLLKRAAVSIIPSEWYENFPMAVLESFAAGTPVIASRIGGLPELIEEGRDGLLFEPGNAEDLAVKIRYFYANPEMALDMSRHAHENFEKKYSAKKHYERLMQIYEKAINLNRGSC